MRRVDVPSITMIGGGLGLSSFFGLPEESDNRPARAHLPSTIPSTPPVRSSLSAEWLSVLRSCPLQSGACCLPMSGPIGGYVPEFGL